MDIAVKALAALLANIEGRNVDDIAEYVPDYMYRCLFDTLDEAIDFLISEHYIEVRIQHISESLAGRMADECKRFLQLHELPSSGSKAVMIERMMSSISLDELENFAPPAVQFCVCEDAQNAPPGLMAEFRYLKDTISYLWGHPDLHQEMLDEDFRVFLGGLYT